MRRTPVLLMLLILGLLALPIRASAAPLAKTCTPAKEFEETLTVVNQTGQTLYMAHLHYDRSGSMGLTFDPTERPECWYTSGWYVVQNGATQPFTTPTDKQNATYIYATANRLQWPRSFTQGSVYAGWVNFKWEAFNEYSSGLFNISSGTTVDDAVESQLVKRPFARIPYATTQCTFTIQSGALNASC